MAGAPAPGGYPTGPARPKRTGLIIALVAGVVVLLCCCAGTAGVLLFSASTNTTTEAGAPEPARTVDPAETKRLADWDAAKAAFPLTGYTTVAADERNAALAKSATGLLYPDFSLDRALVHPGSYDAKTKTWDFDEYVVLLHLTSDPSARVARSFFVSQRGADGLSREDISVDDDETLDRLAGTSWLLSATDTVAPLLRGMKDETWARLLTRVARDWPDGVVSRLSPREDGVATVRIHTWDSYSKSDALKYLEADYARNGDTWTLTGYRVVDDTEAQ